MQRKKKGLPLEIPEYPNWLLGVQRHPEDSENNHEQQQCRKYDIQ